MSHQHGNNEDIEEEYEMQGLDETDDTIRGRDGGGSDSDVDEYDSMDSRTQDTTAAQTREGRDMQGISWERLSTTRNRYRETRLAQYRNYENIPQSGQASERNAKPLTREAHTMNSNEIQDL